MNYQQVSGGMSHQSQMPQAPPPPPPPHSQMYPQQGHQANFAQDYPNVNATRGLNIQEMSMRQPTIQRAMPQVIPRSPSPVEIYPLYECWIFRKATPKRYGEKATWNRAERTAAPFTQAQLAKKINDDQVRKNKSALDRYKDLASSRRKHIDRLIEDKLDEEGDRYEWSVVYLDTEDRNVSRLGYETIKMTVIISRTPLSSRRNAKHSRTEVVDLHEFDEDLRARTPPDSPQNGPSRTYPIHQTPVPMANLQFNPDPRPQMINPQPAQMIHPTGNPGIEIMNNAQPGRGSLNNVISRPMQGQPPPPPPLPPQTFPPGGVQTPHIVAENLPPRNGLNNPGVSAQGFQRPPQIGQIPQQIPRSTPMPQQPPQQVPRPPNIPQQMPRPTPILTNPVQIPPQQRPNVVHQKPPPLNTNAKVTNWQIGSDVDSSEDSNPDDGSNSDQGSLNGDNDSESTEATSVTSGDRSCHPKPKIHNQLPEVFIAPRGDSHNKQPKGVLKKTKIHSRNSSRQESTSERGHHQTIYREHQRPERGHHQTTSVYREHKRPEPMQNRRSPSPSPTSSRYPEKETFVIPSVNRTRSIRSHNSPDRHSFQPSSEYSDRRNRDDEEPRRYDDSISTAPTRDRAYTRRELDPLRSSPPPLTSLSRRHTTYGGGIGGIRGLPSLPRHDLEHEFEVEAREEIEQKKQQAKERVAEEYMREKEEKDIQKIIVEQNLRDDRLRRKDELRWEADRRHMESEARCRAQEDLEYQRLRDEEMRRGSYRHRQNDYGEPRLRGSRKYSDPYRTEFESSSRPYLPPSPRSHYAYPSSYF
ncbi:MAG: hypothetical protein M1834_005487 [Cirrosporium novae-zelandiae]|nr:MAG: hypothetical protein M1834_005487 [Cirrosporium novae-zelandiae]